MQPVPYQSPPPQRPYWTVGKVLGLILGILIIGGIAAFAYSQYRVSQSGVLPIVQVSVSGSAQTGFTSTVVRVEFAQFEHAVSYASCSQFQYGDSCYTSSHSAGVNKGNYSIVLDNHTGWTVFMVYDNYYYNGAYYTGPQYCYAGSVTVNSVSGTYTYDVRC